MIETAMVFDKEGNAIHWHTPPGRSSGYIPDTHYLWDILWTSRRYLGGVAHTHPWNGTASPSGTDLTTFAAIEAGLGVCLLWPIVTFSDVGYFGFNPLTKEYVALPDAFEGMIWWRNHIEELRQRSRGDQHG
jgi:hypothetical protein